MKIDNEVQRFTDAPRAQLSTINPDGTPHLVPIVFAVAPTGDRIYTAIRKAKQEGRPLPAHAEKGLPAGGASTAAAPAAELSTSASDFLSQMRAAAAGGHDAIVDAQGMQLHRRAAFLKSVKADALEKAARD